MLKNNIINTQALLCLWDFESQQPLVSKGKYEYTLQNGGNPVSLEA